MARTLTQRKEWTDADTQRALQLRHERGETLPDMRSWREVADILSRERGAHRKGWKEAKRVRVSGEFVRRACLGVEYQRPADRGSA